MTVHDEAIDVEWGDPTPAARRANTTVTVWAPGTSAYVYAPDDGDDGGWTVQMFAGGTALTSFYFRADTAADLLALLAPVVERLREMAGEGA